MPAVAALVPALWAPFASAQGARRVADLQPGGNGSSPREITDVDGVAFFAASVPGIGTELLLSDGTELGTLVVKDIRAGFFSSSPSELTEAGGALYCAADTADEGLELWRSDGSEAGTLLVKDIREGDTDSDVSNLIELGERLLFVADDPDAGEELHSSDGTAAGTFLVQDINPGRTSSFSTTRRYFAVLGDALLFTATDGTLGFELWRSDGTEAGTFLVKDIDPGGGQNQSDPEALTTVGERVFFWADDGVSGEELWVSDGTESGTALVLDICPGTCSAQPQLFQRVTAALDDLLLFTADDGTHGVELWRSDGTAEGTFMLRDFCPGACDSDAEGLARLGPGVLLFHAIDAQLGNELHRTDGTPAGTTVVRDINLGAEGTAMEELTVHAGLAYFSARTPEMGEELWRSDGTAEGTRPVRDICPGACDSNPFELASSGDLLFLRADDGSTGEELWVAVGAPELTLVGSCPGPLTVNVAGASASSTLALLWAPTAGTVTLGPPCRGKELQLSAARLLTTASTDAEGNLTLAIDAPATACGAVLQAVDVSTCAESDAQALP